VDAGIGGPVRQSIIEAGTFRGGNRATSPPRRKLPWPPGVCQGFCALQPVDFPGGRPITPNSPARLRRPLFKAPPGISLRGEMLRLHFRYLSMLRFQPQESPISMRVVAFVTLPMAVVRGAGGEEEFQGSRFNVQGSRFWFLPARLTDQK
jgi:hypothetical protein